MTHTVNQKVIFTRKETKAFKLYVVEVLLIGVGLYFIAPSGSGQMIAILFAISLIPIPPLVIYLYRKWRPSA
jgi:hypothetical protein